jgi:hypothetical protein
MRPVRMYRRASCHFTFRPLENRKSTRGPSGVFGHHFCICTPAIDQMSLSQMPSHLSPLSGGDPWEASGRRRDALELARRRDALELARRRNALEPAARCPQASGRRQDALETRVHLFVRVGGAQIRVLPGRPVLILPWSAGSVWRKQDSGDGGPIRSSIGMTCMQPRRQKTRTEPGWAR